MVVPKQTSTLHIVLSFPHRNSETSRLFTRLFEARRALNHDILHKASDFQLWTDKFISIT